jgi:hypothetical protein
MSRERSSSYCWRIPVPEDVAVPSISARAIWSPADVVEISNEAESAVQMAEGVVGENVRLAVPSPLLPIEYVPPVIVPSHSVGL